MAGDPKYVKRLLNRMDYVDSLSPEMRKCVHEYGLTIVQAFIDIGIWKPRHIHHLVKVVREGSGEVNFPQRTEDMEREHLTMMIRSIERRGYTVTAPTI